MIALQTVSDLRDVITINDATVTGTLIAIVVAFAVAIVYLYKNVQNLNKDYVRNYTELNEKYIDELRKNNEILLKVNNSYNEFANSMLKIFNQNK